MTNTGSEADDSPYRRPGEIAQRFDPQQAAETGTGQADVVICPYPFTAPAVRPDTMCFWAIAKAITVGRMVSVRKARIFCQSAE
jgi:hypothetical protein